MSVLRKAQGKSPSQRPTELAKLKYLWRDSISEPERARWSRLFLSDTTQAQIRADIFNKLGVNLKSDNRLTEFREWLQEQTEEKELHELLLEARQCPGALQLFRGVLEALKKSKEVTEQQA